MKWKDKLSFLSSPGTEHKVGDATLKFYPISLALAFKLRNIAKPLALALQTLMTSEANDSGSTQREETEGARTIKEFSSVPTNLEIAALRHGHKKEALSNLIDSLTHHDNLTVIGELIIDSLRDTFPRGNPENPPAIEFVSNVEMPHLFQMVMGVLKANKGVFGPLTEAIEKMGTSIRTKIESQVATKMENLADSAKPNPSPATSQTPTQLG